MTLATPGILRCKFVIVYGTMAPICRCCRCFRCMLLRRSSLDQKCLPRGEEVLLGLISNIVIFRHYHFYMKLGSKKTQGQEPSGFVYTALSCKCTCIGTKSSGRRMTVGEQSCELECSTVLYCYCANHSGVTVTSESYCTFILLGMSLGIHSNPR